jgi:hypothetical protein
MKAGWIWVIAWVCVLPVKGRAAIAAKAEAGRRTKPLPSAAIRLSSQTTLLISKDEPGPVELAARDLESDWQKVVGRPLRVVHDPKDAAATTLAIVFNHDVPSKVEKPSGWEKLRLQVVQDPWPGSGARRAVVLTGSDARGTIYAIYQFSQQFLGVDPLYWWTDHEPARRASLSVPDDFSETQGPAFHYRGFFINDEDLLTGWRPGIRDGADISLKTWNRVFEAILRLKGDMVIPGTWIFPYEPQIRLAVKRGLIITQHHVNVLGLDTYRWPDNAPYSFISHPELLEAAWKRSIEEYPKSAGLVWSVGYRGQNDDPFWVVDESAPKTAAARAQVIQNAIGKEIDILKRRHPDAPMVLNAWAEAAGFIRQGLLKVPPGATLVWPDDGHGTLQDRGEIKAGEGEYYHTAMIDYRSNHFSELVPLERIREELGRAAKAGATEYLVVNTSNLRPVVMTSRATMELAWNPKPWIAREPDESRVYLGKWCREEFGTRAAPTLEKYYQAYFAAPAKYGPAADDSMGDQFYQVLSRWLMVAMIKGTLNKPPPPLGNRPQRTLRQMAESIAGRTKDAEARWEEARQLAEQARGLVAPGRSEFFKANVLTQVEINLHGNRMMEDVAEAAETDSAPRRRELIRSAIGEDEAIEAALHAADYGKWKGFYTKGDWLEDVPLTLNLEEAYLRRLEGHSMNLNTLIRAQDGGFAYYMITAYQGTQKVEF